jgi:hypothetical protein
MTPPNVAVPSAPVPMIVTRRVLPAMVDSASAAARVGLGFLRLPFDAARTQYARSVHVGLIEPSMLASRDFECALAALERLCLGPLARRV